MNDGQRVGRYASYVLPEGLFRCLRCYPVYVVSKNEMEWPLSKETIPTLLFIVVEIMALA